MAVSTVSLILLPSHPQYNLNSEYQNWLNVHNIAVPYLFAFGKAKYWQTSLLSPRALSFIRFRMDLVGGLNHAEYRSRQFAPHRHTIPHAVACLIMPLYTAIVGIKFPCIAFQREICSMLYVCKSGYIHTYTYMYVRIQCHVSDLSRRYRIKAATASLTAEMSPRWLVRGTLVTK